MELEKLTGEIERIAKETGSFILNESERFDIARAESKGKNDFFSHVDLESERILVRELGNLIEGSGFLVEEGTAGTEGARFTWVVDPLDGTTNFIHGLHPYAVSIALRENDEVIAGVIHEAGGSETFSAWKNGGAWLNGQRISVSVTGKLSESLIATGFPFRNFDRMRSYLNCLNHLMRNTHGIRRMGSAAIDLAYVACGRYDGFFEYGLNPWDISAGILIIREAGGRVSDFQGNETALSGNEIVAANSLVFYEFLEIVRKFIGHSNV